jgi:hypothetical protein
MMIGGQKAQAGVVGAVGHFLDFFCSSVILPEAEEYLWL